MALVNTKEILEKAMEKGYAVGAFNIHNLETLSSAVKAASEMNSPIILQTTVGTLKHSSEDYIAALAEVASKKYNIPIALQLDHGNSYEIVVKCIRAGFTSVMIDGSHLPYDKNIQLTKKVVELAHNCGVTVEAELGKIVGVEDDIYVNDVEDALTDPAIASEFVERTGIDSLAISIGTAHGLYKGEVKLDFNRLALIRSTVGIPLVLHGASGVPDELVKKSVVMGISKLNIATELKIPFANTIKDVFKNNPDETDPRVYLGKAKESVEKVVREKIMLFGCNDKA